MSAESKLALQPGRIYLFLVAYRWASLLPGLWPIISPPDLHHTGINPGFVLGIAIAITLLVTLFSRSINHLLVRYPYLLGFDFLLAGGLLAISGGTQSPYYLYALSPLLAGAFFFQMRGALLSALTFTPIYMLGLYISQHVYSNPPQPGSLSTQVAGIWLIAILFGYPSVLLKRLRKTRDELEYARDELAEQNLELSATHRQLQIIHDLTLSLQAAPDVFSVGQRVLQVITDDLGFDRAVIGLVNPISERIENWQARPEIKPVPNNMSSLPLAPSAGLLAASLLAEPANVLLPAGQTLTESPELDAWLGAGPWLLVPLVLRENPVGVLLVAVGEDEDAAQNGRLEMLEPVASQAAVALGTTMMCIDRAQRLAVERERNRIARDIHDTVAQSLFGIVFTLDACIAMLRGESDEVRGELEELRDLASNVRGQVRRSIFDLWPQELVLERFKADLSQHASQCCNLDSFRVHFEIQGDFDALPHTLRRTLYQVAQEALANAARHADVESAQVALDIRQDQVQLTVQDQGCGFDPDLVLTHQDRTDRFGLRGMHERIRTLGGEFEISSRPGQGTLVSVHIPMVQQP